MASKNSQEKPKNQKNTGNLAAAAAFARQIDRGALPAKMRVYALAKQLGLASREVVAEFGKLNVKKAAQSSLSKDEVLRLLDTLIAADAGGAAPTGGQEPATESQAEAKQEVEDSASTASKAQAGTKPAKKSEKKAAKKTARKAVRKTTRKAASKSNSPKRAAQEKQAEQSVTAQSEPAQTKPAQEKEEDAKLRTRVRKNVENEIAQIEEKVESRLADSAEPADKIEPVADVEAAADVVAKLHDALVAAGDDLDEDNQPIITPMPKADSETYELAPVFLAPHAQRSAVAPEIEEEPKGARRRGSRGTSRGRGAQEPEDSAEDEAPIEEPKAIKGSTRIEAQRRRRAELREKGRERQHIVSQAEFLARRESVDRTMVVRDKKRQDGAGILTQVGVLEDDLLVEHFVTSEAQTSLIGNIYLGRVQNVLPSMEAAFVDIGQGRNGVLYAGDVDWRATKLGGRSRKIEHALKSGDQVVVQVAKDPIGHKGARLTTQISLAGRYLVYVPGGRSAGISRKLPAPERKRLKNILEHVIPGRGGAIIRTAAENVPEEAIASDVHRLNSTWEDITDHAHREKSSKGAKPVTLYEEPDVLVKVVRDLFNEDFQQLVVDGRRSYNTVRAYVDSMAPDLCDRVVEYDAKKHGGVDAFEAYRIDEQLQKALSRKVWLPSGGTLIIDRTEAMTVIDVNTGKFTGTGGNLEETVTRNNLEAAEEIVRQMRLRDIGGMIVVDFIDMVLPENQDLVLRRLKEALDRDRTRHQVSEVTSLGLVQMTRKRLGTGLLETFSTECEYCQGRGLIIHEYPVDENAESEHNEHGTQHDKSSHHHKSDTHSDKHSDKHSDNSSSKNSGKNSAKEPAKSSGAHPASVTMHHGKSNAEHSEPSHVDSRHSIEDLVANVIVEDEEDSTATAPRGERRHRGRRRAQRTGGQQPRGSREDSSPSSVETSDAAAEDIASIGYAAAENAAAQDEVAEFASYVADEPDDNSAQDNSGRGTSNRSRRTTRRLSRRSASAKKSTTPKNTRSTASDDEAEVLDSHDQGGSGAEKTFAQAQAEFKNSPRRKRRTRGNSRSDHAPRPEDYSEPAQHTDSAEETMPAAQKKVGSDDAAAHTKTPTRSRGRRRAVRSTSKKSAASNFKAQPAQEQSGNNSQAEGSHGGESKVIRRGRKRAVRRVTTGSQKQQGAGQKGQGLAQAQLDGAKPAKAQAPKAEKPGAEAATGGGTGRTRGRRRVARRGRK